MEVHIKDKKKKEIFNTIFSLLKHFTSNIYLTINETTFHIQGMDNSHVILFNLLLYKDWFDYFTSDETYKIAFDVNIFHSIISTKNEDQCFIMKFSNETSDVLHIEMLNVLAKKEFNKYFKMPLMDYEYDEFKLPNVEYDIEMKITSKKMTDIFSQLSVFGENIHILCGEENIDFETKGDSGEMRVNLNVTEDVSSYTIVEGEEFHFVYSLNYLNKICTHKLSYNIDLYLDNEQPMKIEYDLSNTMNLDKAENNGSSNLIFYIATKIE
jgi:proliferating cell nuclear antigen